MYQLMKFSLTAAFCLAVAGCGDGTLEIKTKSENPPPSTVIIEKNNPTVIEKSNPVIIEKNNAPSITKETTKSETKSPDGSTTKTQETSKTVNP